MHAWTNASLPCLVVSTNALAKRKVYYFVFSRAWEYVRLWANCYVMSSFQRRLGKVQQALLVGSVYLSHLCTGDGTALSRILMCAVVLLVDPLREA